MSALYNEFDPFAAEWLRNLIGSGLLPAGDVDTRSIVDVRGDDLDGRDTVHLFAGVGGWPLALRLAGWPDDAPVWTGSCPCQPFSQAGKGEGEADERHLWPDMRRLIDECRPPVVFGEQVASKAGRRWLAGVRADLEAMGYRVGAADLCAAGAGETAVVEIIDECSGEVVYRGTGVVGAPHIRQRLFWVADARHGEPGLFPRRRRVDAEGRRLEAVGRGEADADDSGRGDARGLGHSNGLGEDSVGGILCRAGAVAPGSDSGLVVTDGDGSREGSRTATSARHGGSVVAAGDWGRFALVPCRDGKLLRVSAQPGDEPLAYGLPRDLGRVRALLEGMGYGPKDVRRLLRRPRSLLALAARNRVGRLKGYGNAIVPQVAAEFVAAYLDTRST